MLVVSSYVLQIHCTAIFMYAGILIHHLPLHLQISCQTNITHVRTACTSSVIWICDQYINCCWL